MGRTRSGHVVDGGLASTHAVELQCHAMHCSRGLSGWPLINKIARNLIPLHDKLMLAINKVILAYKLIRS